MNLLDYIKSFTQYEPEIIQSGDCIYKLRTCLPWTKESNGLCLALNVDYLKIALKNPCVKAVIIDKLIQNYVDNSDTIIVTAKEPELLFCDLHSSSIHTINNDDLAQNCKIAESAEIHPTAIIEENVIIGERVHIGAYSVIHANTYIDSDVWIGTHVIVGAESLYSRNFFGKKKHLPQWGGVKIGKRCRISPQCIIAKSTYAHEYTELADDVHLSFQVTVGHDVNIGEGGTVSSQVAIGGRTVIGKNCWVGLNATISNTLNIGDGASVKLGSVVIDKVAPKAQVSGNFAIPHLKNMKNKLLNTK